MSIDITTSTVFTDSVETKSECAYPVLHHPARLALMAGRPLSVLFLSPWRWKVLYIPIVIEVSKDGTPKVICKVHPERFVVVYS
jgi:hypothetical protein